MAEMVRTPSRSENVGAPDRTHGPHLHTIAVAFDLARSAAACMHPPSLPPPPPSPSPLSFSSFPLNGKQRTR